MDVFADGRVKFNGERNVQRTGMQTAASVRALADEIEASEFAAADTAYMYGSARCGAHHTDLPVTVLTAKAGARRKTIRHDPGCQAAPGFLGTLEARIDSVAGTSRWITGKRETSR